MESQGGDPCSPDIVIQKATRYAASEKNCEGEVMTARALLSRCDGTAASLFQDITIALPSIHRPERRQTTEPK